MATGLNAGMVTLVNCIVQTADSGLQLTSSRCFLKCMILKLSVALSNKGLQN